MTTEIVDGERVDTHSSRAEERVISLATILEPLPYSFQITGLTVNEARELAFLLRAGALAAPMYIVEERTVGASLGEENIERGMIAVALGFGLVLRCSTDASAPRRSGSENGSRPRYSAAFSARQPVRFSV